MNPFLVVLGIAQDAGYPQAGCRGDCCAPAWRDHTFRRYPCCVAVVDPESDQRWLFDCTPRFPEQLRDLNEVFPVDESPGIDRIFLTHAHIGHYTGLMYLGREAMDARGVPVYAMPRMGDFLRRNGPWSLLVASNNMTLNPLADQQPVKLNERLSVTPMVVPHRGELSETVAFVIQGPNRTVLYLPDIDDWDLWEAGIERILNNVDRAYLDGTFFSRGELRNRDLQSIPHPFIVDSIKRFSRLPPTERDKVRFLHFNHSNPALCLDSDAANVISNAGHHVAEQGEMFEL